jgi:hypothetical protein
LWFVCPGCKQRNEDSTGLKRIPVGDTQGKEPSWTFDGNLEAPTLSPSILTRVNYPDKNHVCHSFLRAGHFEFLGDCTHSMANQRVPLPPLPDWFMKEEAGA